ncbi:MAG: hypothetical protein UX47_C0012G0006 [Candidatus Collierbacteria bacterium GW2011_GWA2_46_26]|uniref:Uncharacterized protein n=1 Tax=Candidatus Collierbacteria bacterium GW2011_GWA2_46_26 TaxID=1618381 RepID=A0A0G1RR16_9BACT|nr:MAG: hypothetical protein UX47_C0012G0006 [Candidatus Collierbacteria bacterium GW2011_GWA2_46_26]
MNSRKIVVGLFVVCCAFLVIFILGLVALNGAKTPAGTGGGISSASSPAEKPLTKVIFRDSHGKP